MHHLSIYLFILSIIIINIIRIQIILICGMLVLFRYIKESQILCGVSSVAELSFITSFTSRAGAANILTVL